MRREAINFEQKPGLFDDHWAPKVIAEMKDYQFKLARLEGDFVWHDHPDRDETFIGDPGGQLASGNDVWI